MCSLSWFPKPKTLILCHCQSASCHLLTVESAGRCGSWMLMNRSRLLVIPSLFYQMMMALSCHISGQRILFASIWNCRCLLFFKKNVISSIYKKEDRRSTPLWKRHYAPKECQYIRRGTFRKLKIWITHSLFHITLTQFRCFLLPFCYLYLFIYFSLSSFPSVFSFFLSVFYLSFSHSFFLSLFMFLQNCFSFCLSFFLPFSRS